MWKSIILDVECIVCNKSLQKINHDPREVTIKMGKIANRRSRTPNWSADEKQYLLELIKERRQVITKNTNGPNHNEEKDTAWNEILRALSHRFGNKFDGSSIKKVKTQWQNMKRIAREEITLNGPDIQKFTRQSLEVCHILELVQNGVLNKEIEANLNETNLTSTMPNIEIKAERIDEEPNQPSCSNSHFMDIDNQQESLPQSLSQPVSQYESSSSSPEHQSEPPEYEPEEPSLQQRTIMKNASSCTETSFLEETCHSNPFSRNFREFMRFSEAERQLKIEALKEERHVVRAMRETAELNKIIAEQRLKHLLWVKKHEMAKTNSS